MQFTEVTDGWIRGNGIVDGRPIEEFYNPATGEFSKNAPILKRDLPTDEKKELYKDMLIEMGQKLTQKIPAGARVAVLDFKSGANQTMLGKDIASKIEAAIIDDGMDVVDRESIDKAFNEHELQQKDSALFDATTVAQLGKLMGANVVVFGNYNITLPHKLTVTAKALSVETSKVLTRQEAEIPLTGTGADNRETVMSLEKIDTKEKQP